MNDPYHYENEEDEDIPHHPDNPIEEYEYSEPTIYDPPENPYEEEYEENLIN